MPTESIVAYGRKGEILATYTYHVSSNNIFADYRKRAIITGYSQRVL